ncbi:iron complex transport system substrate-binding protein [Pycnococcus provasolii]
MMAATTTRRDNSLATLRVISLLSATTEICHRLGCHSVMVGRSHGCDDPSLALALPIVTAPKVDPNAPSADIDSQVRAQAASGGPVYRIHAETVAELRPTVIITQDHCRICAVTSDDVANACERLPNPQAAKVVTVSPTTFDDVLEDVRSVAAALGVQPRGDRLVRHMKERVEVVRREAVAERGEAPRPKIAHLEWVAPLMGSGYWIAECCAAAGCEMVLGTAGGNSPTLTGIEALASADVIVVAPCGFSIERTKAELDACGLASSPAFRELPAVRAGRCFVADGNKYWNRSSCGIVETCEMAAEMAWPELAGLWGHHGERWVRLSELDAFCSRPGAQPVTKPVVLAEADDPMVPAKAAPLGARRAEASAVEVVNAQLAALFSGDWDGAFALNSKPNCARLGDAAKFAGVVRSSASFSVLVDKGREVEVWECGSDVTVRARVEGRPETTFQFMMVREDGAWCTDGVRVEC